MITSKYNKQKKKGTRFASSPLNLVRLAGIEPTTPWFVAKYSIQLSYSREEQNYSNPTHKEKPPAEKTLAEKSWRTFPTSAVTQITTRVTAPELYLQGRIEYITFGVGHCTQTKRRNHRQIINLSLV